MFPLERENSLVDIKKITALPIVSFLFYRLKMESFLCSLNPRANEENKLQNEGQSAENVQRMML